MKVRPTRAGFTIVELLVVISIIAMLSAILLPAVNSARAAARQMACIQNQGQIGKAIAQYAATKGKLPSYVSEHDFTPNDSSDSPVLVGWTYRILPIIDKQPVKDALDRQDPSFDDYYLQLLVCPDDSVSVLENGPMSYAANGGLSDSFDTEYPDWRDNGSLGRSFLPSSNQSTLSNTIDFISSHDGVSTTLLVAENINNVSAGRASWRPGPAIDGDDFTLKNYEVSQTVLWHEEVTNDNFGGFTAINEPRNADTFDQVATDPYLMSAFVPSGPHSGGVVVTFCDGHTIFLSELVDYDVYARAMTSNGANARLPGEMDDTNGDGQPGPDPLWQIEVLTDTQLQP